MSDSESKRVKRAIDELKGMDPIVVKAKLVELGIDPLEELAKLAETTKDPKLKAEIWEYLGRRSQNTTTH